MILYYYLYIKLNINKKIQTKEIKKQVIFFIYIIINY